MQIQRPTSTPAVDLAAAVLRSAATPQQHSTADQKSVPTAAAAEQTKTEELPKQRKAGQSMPDMSSSDRAAIAASTGFSIAPTGEVAPDGMPPWSFIMQTLEKRHTQGATETQPAQEAASTAGSSSSDGTGVDVLA
jgi:hypothetical protein